MNVKDETARGPLASGRASGSADSGGNKDPGRGVPPLPRRRKHHHPTPPVRNVEEVVQRGAVANRKRSGCHLAPSRETASQKGRCKAVAGNAATYEWGQGGRLWTVTKIGAGFNTRAHTVAVAATGLIARNRRPKRPLNEKTYGGDVQPYGAQERLKVYQRLGCVNRIGAGF